MIQTRPENIQWNMSKTKNKEYYVNNKEFLEALIDYKTKVERAKLQDKPKPRIPNYIGECFLKIATHLSYKPNFVNYMFREEMISDGIENCVQYIDNFDPVKSKNPFAYFTQIIWYAFLRRIQKEKKQLDIKAKIVEKTGFEHLMYTDKFDGDLAGLNQSYSDMTSIKENIEVRMDNR